MKPQSSDDYEVEVTIDNLSLSNGIKYSVDVIGVNGALSGSLQHSHGVIVDTTPPIMSKVIAVLLYSKYTYLQFKRLTINLELILTDSSAALFQLYIGMFGPEESLNDDGEIIHDDHYGIPASWVGYDHESGIVRYLLAVGTSEGTYSIRPHIHVYVYAHMFKITIYVRNHSFRVR